ncbi:hypothetical protein [Granulicella mallensis]|uniref:Glutathionylspermidine synthase n=1 Tax=Granulicella mallensis (strain ATCC BAA-1857 / DSM 23137 / MP5ACTX8) TaxID=682795 RepID=G8NNX3_GRAMM|nr:hypothetical protein [Granulicella mallensis]AEU37077.1 hypothetical protein AciX8_2767 [Granulicella mallensis MP5ACTX8]
MIEPFRSDFNARFTQAKYAELLQRLNERTQTQIEFRVAETPCFFSSELMERMVHAGVELTSQLLGNVHYMRDSAATVPAAYRVPHEDAHPHFMAVDFGLVRDEWGRMQPKLVEMQAFPSLFGYQAELSRAYIEVYGLDRELRYFLGGLDETGYWSLLREVIVGRHDPRNVVLAEIAPEIQKTLPDFRVHEQRLGIKTVDVAKLIKQGKKLFYREESTGQLVPIHRIYNRVIVDELERKGIVLPFDYRDELEVEWAGHPNWYFRVSKFSLPHLDHPTVPPAIFLDDWYAGVGRDRLPEDRSEWVFKPLYSFAGKGIQFAPTDADLAAVPPVERHNYLLQQRMHFEPVIQTPEGPTQPEVRILYVWPEGKSMVPMMSLVRMGRGLMMGVDHNRDRTWVGSSAGLVWGGG